MAKKIKFSLAMADAVSVRTLEELQAHFDMGKILQYFIDGKLVAWLEDRYYNDMASRIKLLDKNDSNLNINLCEILEVKYDNIKLQEIDLKEVELKNQRRTKLKQYTSDEDVLSRVDKVAFNQNELEILIKDETKKIYLCNNQFVIPLDFKNVKYIGISEAIAIIKSEVEINFSERNIQFENVQFDDCYKKVVASNPEGLHKKVVASNPEDLFKKAFEYMGF